MTMGFRHAVVLGTGLMSPGITAAVASAGLRVTVVGRDAAKAQRVVDEAHSLSTTPTVPVVAAGIEMSVFTTADLVIENIVEDLATKSAVIGRISPWLHENAIIASNTSSLPLDELAAASSRPHRVGGLHFLNPAHLTTVVEVIASTGADTDVALRLTDLVRAMGKFPIQVAVPIPGYVWTRIQFAVLRECVALLESGVTDRESIDAAVADGLAPRWIAGGPLATADLGGSGTFSRIAQQLFPQLASGGEVVGSLGRGEPFFAWTDQHRSAAKNLRQETLEAGARFAEKRRRSAPPSTAGD